MLSVAQASQTDMAILGAINVAHLQEPNMEFQLASKPQQTFIEHVLCAEWININTEDKSWSGGTHKMVRQKYDKYVTL